nr:MAG TPA: hypothetical protein [Caudoviricetes sp.]
MTNNNYMNAINEAKKLLKELLNDPDHGKLTFKGLRGLNDLTITHPYQLETTISGTVLTIGAREWMALSMGEGEPRLWQSFRGAKRVTSEELYLLALKRPDDLTHCHGGF